MSHTLSVCGTECSNCDFYNQECKGCNELKGKVFHASEGKACVIYECCVDKKQFKNCHKCQAIPCETWLRTKDPSLTEEEFMKGIMERVANLKAAEWRGCMNKRIEEEQMQRLENTMYPFVPKYLGKQIGVGATASVYEYEKDKIIKIFHKNTNETELVNEYKRGKSVEQTGLPVPKNFGLCRVVGTGNIEIDECFGLIQEKIVGSTVMNQIMSNPEQDFIALMMYRVVDLQVQMHKIDATNMSVRNQKQTLRYGISVAPFLSDDEKQQLYNLLERLPEGNRLCHGDYHFDNVFFTENGLVCFDWCDASCGNPSADLARSLLIFQCEAMPDSIPQEIVQLTKSLSKSAGPLYLKAYEEQGGVYDNLEAWKAIVAAGRLFCEVKDNQPAMLKIVRDYLKQL